jgi:hydrogenase expression/formation protein HypE
MERILLGHGSGGKLMHKMIREYFAPEFHLGSLGDSAIIQIPKVCDSSGSPVFAFTTDSYVVSPLFFPGGNIGDLAINGTVNDLSVVGSTPLYIATGFIIEEGFPVSDLKRVIASMAEAAKKAGVSIVAGDTKVVDKGKGDGLFINTSGIGIIPGGRELGPHKVLEGDRVVISGPMGNHGIAVMAERNGLAFDPPVISDTAALNSLVTDMLSISGAVHMMRDPTRGGVATTLKEIALESGQCISINEQLLPVPDGVRGACELLGLDPLYVANEGILLAIVTPGEADGLIEKMKEHPLGTCATVIGEVSRSESRDCGMVLLETAIGGTRIIDMLAGEQLPRIC